MADHDLRARIEAEITKSLQALGMPPTTPSLASSQGALSAALERHGAPIALRAIIGSRGDTLTEAEVLEALEIYNKAKQSWRSTWTRASSEAHESPGTLVPGTLTSAFYLGGLWYAPGPSKALFA